MVRLSSAIESFLLHKSAEGRSRHTLADYRVGLGKLFEFLDDVVLSQITVADLRRFFAYLNTDYVTTPAGCAPRPQQQLAPKTIRNIHAAISSFYTWAMDEGLADDNPMRRIQRPKAPPPPIEPLSQADLVALLDATRESCAWRTRPATRNRRPTAARDRAIILLLLDTGLRASELCNLRLEDLNLTTGHVRIHRGKGGRSRTVRASQPCRRALRRYLATRRDDLPADAPLFASAHDEQQPLTRYALRRLLKRLGERAGVDRVHPHRFRHTFAIEYLRNGGDIYTLQEILGHSSLDMVRRYLHIVQTDVDQRHKTASPVTNWRL